MCSDIHWHYAECSSVMMSQHWPQVTLRLWHDCHAAWHVTLCINSVGKCRIATDNCRWSGPFTRKLETWTREAEMRRLWRDQVYRVQPLYSHCTATTAVHHQILLLQTAVLPHTQFQSPILLWAACCDHVLHFELKCYQIQTFLALKLLGQPILIFLSAFVPDGLCQLSSFSLINDEFFIH